MELLYAFAALSLACACVLTLLPSGSLRRTAAMALGLLLTLLWFDGLSRWLRLPMMEDAPSTPLEQSEASLITDTKAAWEAARRIAARRAASAAGCDTAKVTLDQAGHIISVVLPKEGDAEAAAEALNIGITQVVMEDGT